MFINLKPSHSDLLMDEIKIFRRKYVLVEQEMFDRNIILKVLEMLQQSKQVYRIFLLMANFT